jgi:hypothetical protein
MKNTLQYIILGVGTVIFSIFLYLLVQTEKGESSSLLINEDFNHETIEYVIIYSLPDNNSKIVGKAPAKTKVQSTTETKFYYKIVKIEGQTKIKDGYILKRQLKKI